MEAPAHCIRLNHPPATAGGTDFPQSDGFSPPEIVQMNYSEQARIVFNYDQRSDLAVLHQVQSCHCECRRMYRHWSPGHAFTGFEVHGVFAAALEQAAEVAIADY